MARTPAHDDDDGDDEEDDGQEVSDSETLVLPGPGSGAEDAAQVEMDWAEDAGQWWYPPLWMLDDTPAFCFNPGNPRWAWDQ